MKKAKLFSRPEITVRVHFYSIGPKMCYFVISVIHFDPKVLGSLFAMYVEAKAPWSTTLKKAKLFSRPVGINKMHFRGSLCQVTSKDGKHCFPNHEKYGMSRELS